MKMSVSLKRKKNVGITKKYFGNEKLPRIIGLLSLEQEI